MTENKEEYHRELLIQKEISESLNKSLDMGEMLQQTLEKLLELMGLETGWIFLTDDESTYHLAAYQNLPPALSRDELNPVLCKDGCKDCACLELYWEGDLNQAVNSIKCVRLEEAVSKSTGETWGLTHHATIPLTIREKKFGLLNLASLGRKRFDKNELILLEAVAYQIGTAVERMRLDEERKQQEVDSIARYLVDYYASTEKINRQIGNINNRNELFNTIIKQIGTYFDFWPTVAIITKENNQLTLRAISDDNYAREITEVENGENLSIIRKAYEEQIISQSYRKPLYFPSLKERENLYSIAMPLLTHERPNQSLGVLLISRESTAFSNLEMEMLEVLASQISMAIEKVRLHEEWEALLVEKERNRLARDLHDAVNQKLFALSLTSRGLKEIVDSEDEMTAEAIHDIQLLSQEALSEMRGLIWQLRPYELDKGLRALLEDYTKKIGLQLYIEMSKDITLPGHIEEALWRIAQEALNNISKHANTKLATIRLESDNNHVKMWISDEGCGGVVEKQQSLGITSMNERASEIHGFLHIDSVKGQGTTITVTVPMNQEEV